MVESLKNPIMSVSDYVDWESQQTEKHDFLGNEVFDATEHWFEPRRADDLQRA